MVSNKKGKHRLSSFIRVQPLHPAENAAFFEVDRIPFQNGRDMRIYQYIRGFP